MLGVLALPLGAVLFVLAQVLGPRLLEPVPEMGARPAAPRRSGRRLGLGPRQTGVLRAGGAVAVLALIAFGVSRWPSASGGGQSQSRSVAPAVEIQLPPPISLRTQVRAGADGTGEGQVHDPRDVAVDPAGNLYVADTGNKRVVKFKADGTFVTAWSTPAQGVVAEPSSIAVAKDGVILDDSEAGQLHKYDFDGKPIAGFEHDLAISHPRGIAVGPDGTIYVGDTANNRILKVGQDGAPRGDFDTKGAKLEQPTGVAVDDQGAVYSLEPAASRIQKFAADGTLQAHMYLPSAVTVYPPRAVWLPGKGLVVSLPDQNELLTYSPEGVPSATFAPEAPVPLRPLGIAAAPDRQSVWVLWNTSATLTQLLWP